MKRFKAIIVCLSFFLILSGFGIQTFSAQADEGLPSIYEQALLDRINHARQNPLSVAHSMGLNIQPIIQRNPELYSVFLKGISPLLFNEKLFKAATQRTYGMLDSPDDSDVFRNGETPEYRVLEAGYLPFEAAEAISFVAFNNFIDPMEAVDILFQNMFRDELDTASTGRLKIFNPEFEDIGISIEAGTVFMNDRPTNAYVATCQFGSDAGSAVKSDLFHWINAARYNPQDTLALIAAEGAISSSKLGNIDKTIVQEGAVRKPLTPNDCLESAAEMHTLSMVRDLYLDNIGLDGLGPLDRIQQASGCEVQAAAEVIGALVVKNEHVLPFEAGEILLEEMLQREMQGESKTRILLNPDATESGLAFDLISLAHGDEFVLVYLLTADLAYLANPFGGGFHEIYDSFVVEWKE